MPHFDVSKETGLIFDRLIETKPGDLIEYRELHNLTGINDKARLRGFFNTARNHAFRERQFRFRCERGVGYMRLDEGGKNAEVSHKLTRITRNVRRTTKLHAAVAFNALDAAGKLTHVVNATQLSEIKKAASRGHRNLIEKTAAENKTVEAVVDGTLQMFKKRKRA